MAHKRIRRRPESEEVELSMTPMIDIVFQLLIYFILTFETPDVIAHLDVFRPSPEKEKKEEIDIPPNLLQITIYEDGFVLNDRVVNVGEMERILDRLASLNKNQTVLIMATAYSKHEGLVQVLDLCAKTGLTNISVVSTN